MFDKRLETRRQREKDKKFEFILVYTTSSKTSQSYRVKLCPNETRR